MIRFILNDSDINTVAEEGMTLLDFVRYERNLKGTKIGCREGDCGACTVLVGAILNNELVYQSVTSCLMPLGNVNGKHIVTIEGINLSELNAVQQAMSDAGATQCGFCTPGFVMSIAGFCLQDKNDNPIAAIDGNICRCTGYKSIERACFKIADLIRQRDGNDIIKYAIEKKIIPAYFLNVKERIQALGFDIDKEAKTEVNYFVGGGTDLYVQKHEEMAHSRSRYLSYNSSMKNIEVRDGRCVIGASATVTDLIQSPEIRKIFPSFLKYSKLVSSTPIRNMASIGGNFVNASPIGDFTVFFLALNAEIVLSVGTETRELYLRDFYKGYKSLDKKPDEYIESLSFEVPQSHTFFNFEKVSKRTNLDIASVNSALRIIMADNKIESAMISAGGVGPIPMYLKKASEFLSGKELSEEIIRKACIIAAEEISPISDARGTAGYKTFLLQQLIKGHFITLFPSMSAEKLLIAG